MSCGLSRQELIAFDIPRQGQYCKGEYKDANGNICTCDSLISEHRAQDPGKSYSIKCPLGD